jgi:hypothetical protein
MNKYDILVIIYPNLANIEKVIIINPFDNKVQSFDIRHIDDLRKILKESLPFCDQGHEPYLHFGSAYLISWEDLPSSKLSIKFPEDIDRLLS